LVFYQNIRRNPEGDLRRKNCKLLQGCHGQAKPRRSRVTKRNVFGIARRGTKVGKRPAVNNDISTRERILNAAVQIAAKNGIKSLTQPNVAKQAGVTQSLLTYYFPRKTDLLTAVLEASHQDVGRAPPANVHDALRFMEALIFDPNRMRFFLGAVVEAGEEPALRKVLAEHAAALTGQMAEIFGRPADDPAVVAFVDRVRGLGVRSLLEPKRKSGQKIDLARIASEHGLV
jgi:AcrR family transcriptional regulator